MKKAVCLFLMILMFCSLTIQVFAKNEGLVNEAERGVITAVGEILSIVNGAEFSTADRKIFENYFKTRTLEDEEANTAKEYLDKASNYYAKLGKDSYSELSEKEKIYFCNYLKKAADTLGLTLTFTYDKKVELRNGETSELVYKQEQIIKATGQTPYILLGVFGLLCIFAVTIRLRKVSKEND